MCRPASERRSEPLRLATGAVRAMSASPPSHRGGEQCVWRPLRSRRVPPLERRAALPRSAADAVAANGRPYFVLGSRSANRLSESLPMPQDEPGLKEVELSWSSGVKLSAEFCQGRRVLCVPLLKVYSLSCAGGSDPCSNFGTSPSGTRASR